MAKQTGILPLQGTIGEITFYKKKNGFFARRKQPTNPTILTSDRSQRTRENMSEFSRAAKASKLLRTSLNMFLQNASDSSTHNRLLKLMFAILKNDLANARGFRTVQNGPVDQLERFDFNSDGKLDATFYAPFDATINRATGEFRIDIPSFVSANLIKAPEGATSFRINSAGVELDLAGNNYNVVTHSTPPAIIDNQPGMAIGLSNMLTAGSPFPLVLVMGIEFYQAVNGQLYQLKNGNFNALSVVRAIR